MEFDWPSFPARAAHFIETGKIEESFKVVTWVDKVIQYEVKMLVTADVMNMKTREPFNIFHLVILVFLTAIAIAWAIVLVEVGIWLWPW